MTTQAVIERYFELSTSEDPRAVSDCFAAPYREHLVRNPTWDEVATMWASAGPAAGLVITYLDTVNGCDRLRVTAQMATYGTNNAFSVAPFFTVGPASGTPRIFELGTALASAGLRLCWFTSLDRRSDGLEGGLRRGRQPQRAGNARAGSRRAGMDLLRKRTCIGELGEQQVPACRLRVLWCSGRVPEAHAAPAHNKRLSVRFESEIKEMPLRALLLFTLLAASCAAPTTVVTSSPSASPTVAATPTTVEQTPTPRPTAVPRPGLLTRAGDAPCRLSGFRPMVRA